MSYFDTLKKQIIAESKFINESASPEYGITTSIRDTRRASDIINDIPKYRRMQSTYGHSDVFTVDSYDDLLDLRDILESEGIEIIGFIVDGENVDQLDEMSTAAGAGAYSTPNAFGKLPNDKVEQLGFKKVAKKKSNSGLTESTYARISKELFLTRK